MANFSALPVGVAATLASIYEATARKPGNVHPGASFADLTYADFVASAVAIGPALQRACAAGVGTAVLEAVRATRAAVGTNTNLGTLLLFAPLAVVPSDINLADGIDGVLEKLTNEDTRLVYEAIRLSSAGGLGEVKDADVHADVPADLTLVDVMRLAADRDLVARQYVIEFADVFSGPAMWIAAGVSSGWPLSPAIMHAHLRQMARHPDSLIARKCGVPLAVESRERAAVVLAAGLPGEAAYEAAVVELDGWLRADGNRRNPGTSADFVAAGLFVLLREGRLDWTKVAWS
ncbi:MAG: triphosphoribosyl-dephospho-CoA synthase [Planctomycetes bacterium]|nr:triphosphoribosyl-dephospho-CoA synthase [Planctomycetota bacterium]